MTINHIRFLNIVFVVFFITTAMHSFLWYIAVMHLSLEILNSRHLYLQHQYKLYNFIFWAYSLVLLERLRTSHLSETTEWVINCAEHLFFGIIICIKVYIYTTVFSKASKATRWKRAMIAFALFNIIGLFNEVFQNSLGNRSLFVFIPDSIKDIKMNLLGAAVFMMAVLCRISWLKRMA
jgi:hypothetical protein